MTRSSGLQPHPDAVFSAHWLALRAAADRAARDRRLEARAAAWLSARRRQSGGRRSSRLVDLGSGSGANPRHLVGRLPGPQHWTLIDHDAALLQEAACTCRALRDADGRAIDAETRCLDLHELDATQLADADLVCASALLDLVDAAWLDRLADACAVVGCAVLVTLSVDGTWRFDRRPPTPHTGRNAAEPRDGGLPAGAADAARPSTGDADVLAAGDDLVRAAFNAHQRRDKGWGPALGPDAAHALAERLEARGFLVELAPSPWRLALDEPDQAMLARALLDGWRDAAREQRPDAADRIAAWHSRRIDGCGRQGTVLEVGHLDLFAVPRLASD